MGRRSRELGRAAGVALRIVNSRVRDPADGEPASVIHNMEFKALRFPLTGCGNEYRSRLRR